MGSQSVAPEQRTPVAAMAVTAGPKPVQITRKPSIKEQPSYLKEVSVALSRREELLKLRERMSAAKLIMDADPSAKPWLLSRSISNTSIKEDILVTRERNIQGQGGVQRDQ